jgi:endonuclease YncB( thermonuclease family)
LADITFRMRACTGLCRRTLALRALALGARTQRRIERPGQRERAGPRGRAGPGAALWPAWVLAWVLWAAPAPPALAQQTTAPDAGAAPAGFFALAVPGGATVVHDGDTFDADLDGDGRVEVPRERVRLLYVDTPELHESPKGEDRVHGLPAREFLAARVLRRPLRLYIPRGRSTGLYGRTLALVEAGGEQVNLALIRAGHSYFDTRFSFPADYAAYAAAEGEAFDARRGIWGDAPSRERYLKRLKFEHKTPAARSNALYRAGVQEARGFRPAAFLGRYVTLAGTLRGQRRLSKDVRLLQLVAGPGVAPLAVVAFPEIAQKLELDAWPAGAQVQVQGFVQSYRGRLELLLHYARRTR